MAATHSARIQLPTADSTQALRASGSMPRSHLSLLVSLVAVVLGCASTPRYSPVTGTGGEPRPAAEVVPRVRAGSEVAITFARPTTLLGARASGTEPERVIERAARLAGYVVAVAGDTLEVRARHVYANGRTEQLVPPLVFRVPVDPADVLLTTSPNAGQRVAGPLLYVGAALALVAGIFAIAALGSR